MEIAVATSDVAIERRIERNHEAFSLYPREPVVPAMNESVQHPGESRRPAYGELDEPALLERLRAGDEHLFREVVIALTPTMLRLARSYVPTDAAAQDAVQDTWLTVLDRLDSFEGRSTLKTWVCGILVNLARRSGVRDARTLPFSSVNGHDREPAVDPDRFHSRRDAGITGTWASPPVRWDLQPEEQLMSGELRRVIESAIAALPLRQRELITARDALGMDAGEAAEILGLTQSNQRVLLHRARSKVRAAVERYAAGIMESPQDRSGHP